ncbi:translation elongation factor EF1A [Striga asiatica]|uniref:Translation elongation factor EF1A n=1 Tax=Striga asiatica TaxID=4170 RepID=A0A5A7Q7I1_STRAF|nr:translation elongation factor EF1A [Striga asiatica]
MQKNIAVAIVFPHEGPVGRDSDGLFLLGSGSPSLSETETSPWGSSDSFFRQLQSAPVSCSSPNYADGSRLFPVLTSQQDEAPAISLEVECLLVFAHNKKVGEKAHTLFVIVLEGVSHYGANCKARASADFHDSPPDDAADWRLQVNRVDLADLSNAFHECGHIGHLEIVRKSTGENAIPKIISYE